ncbi:MAG: hypothetical protein CR974_03840 [Gammaproteobacteria bacterium]|nr:MAG: hypothetical protein CR974_03840 [Gammaproteobacteria bacterium]
MSNDKKNTNAKDKPTGESKEVAVERNLTEIEVIDNILTEKLGNDVNAYRDLLTDTTVIGCWTQRQTALTKLERQVIPHDSDNPADVEAAEFIEAQLKRINIDAVLKAMHWGIYYGRSVGEVMWGIEDGKVVLNDIRVRDRALFKFDIDKSLIFTGNDSDEKMPAKKFWTFSTGGDTTDNPYGLGLAHFLFWAVLFKKSNIRFWLLGNEKMATSVPYITFDPRGEKKEVEERRKKAAKAVYDLKNGSGIAIPEGATVGLLKGISGTTDYETLSRYMDEAIALVTLGQVMTSQAVGGQYKAEVQDSVKDDIVKADADLLCASLNNTVVKWLTEWNFPNAKPPKVWLLTQDEIDQQATSATYANIAKLGYRPTIDTVQDTLGGEWEEIPTAASAPTTAEENNDKVEGEENNKDEKDFAEADGETLDIADQASADNVTDKLLHFSDRELGQLTKPEIATLLQINAETREQLADELLNKFPDLPFSEMESFLTKLLFIAGVAGEVEQGGNDGEA